MGIMDQKPHILLLTFPAQGHINPSLQFAKRLLRSRCSVTFVTCLSAFRRMSTLPDSPSGLSFATISDGYDDGFNPKRHDIHSYMSMFKERGAQTLTQLVRESIQEGRVFTCVVYTLLLPWVAEVARSFHLPSALLWIQPATIFSIYYHYFNGYKDLIQTSGQDTNDRSFSLELPGLPLKFELKDLPSFLLPSTPYTFALPTFKDQFEELDKEQNPRILVNTFDLLEPSALKSFPKYNLVAVGPLLPSAFLDGVDPRDKSFGADLFSKTQDDYLTWLDSQEESSVVYVSFGSISVLSRHQMEEVAWGLLETTRPFLWVIREKEENDDKNNEELSCKEELEKRGKIVKWCSQVEVLWHKATGCFVTHCGWNSTMESIVAGMPVVGFPQWTDQPTNGKMVEDMWKTGVRVRAVDGVVGREEIRGCVEKVMGSKEMRENAQKWREKALMAAKEGGSSDRNVRAFVQEVSNFGHHGIASNNGHV